MEVGNGNKEGAGRDQGTSREGLGGARRQGAGREKEEQGRREERG